ncbi:MAG: ABC transporter ATP-binding protein [Alphaproteobacteria bacterium]
MARIVLEDVAHSYVDAPAGDGDWALKQLDHVWEDGGAYALLGPSGCGKTTLLNVISGLVAPTRGRVLFDDRDVTGLRTERRNIAQVFQFPVIYDTMTVFENLAFPLRNHKMNATRIRERVHEVAEMLELTDDLGRRAQRVTVDVKQKISLGRGLVRDDVAAILFDEPLTVIDPHLKWLLRRKLKEIHKRLRLTLIYVTHDQNEALTFADRVVVMYEGRVLQNGTPRELFEAPQHAFVGYFIGSPGMNFIPCELDGDAALAAGARIALSPGIAAAAARMGGRFEIGVRPECLNIADGAADGAVAAGIDTVEDYGEFRIVTARLGAQTVKVRVRETQPVPADTGYLVFSPETTKLYADGRLVV